MKVCIIVHDYLPDSTRVTAKMMHELAVEFKNFGHQVTVITAGYKIGRNYLDLNMDGVRVLKFKSGLINSNSKLVRLINESLLSLRAWFYLKNELIDNPHDLIVFWTPSIFWGPLVRKLKKKWEAKTFLLLRDFFPQWLFDSKQLREKSLLAYFFKHYEKICYMVSDKIGLQSPNNLTWFENNINRHNELVLLYNWVSDAPARENRNVYRDRLNINNKILFFYGGNIGPAQDLTSIINLAISLIDEKDYHFLLVGSGYDYKKIQEMISENNLKNVTLMPAVPQNEYLDILGECDVGLICLSRLHKTHNFPGKLLNYMVQRKPILGVVNSGNDVKEVVESNGAGFISVAGDNESLVANALRFKNPEDRKKMAANSRNLYKKYFSISQAVETIIKVSL